MGIRIKDENNMSKNLAGKSLQKERTLYYEFFIGQFLLLNDQTGYEGNN
jgi:hypothetical protein